MQRSILFGLLALMLTVQSCVSPAKLVLNGEYDSAINALVKKVNKTEPKQKNLELLERAFHNANQEDFDRIKFLKLSGEPGGWPEIFYRYQAMETRQRIIAVLPEAVKSSIHYKPLNFQQDMVSAKLRAQEYLSAKVKSLLASSERSDARHAMELLDELQKLSPDYPEVQNLRRQAVLQATEKVLIVFENKSGNSLPAKAEAEIMRISVGGLDESLLKFDVVRRKDIDYDYLVKVSLREIEISPERVDRRHYTEKREIMDGMQPVRDSNGNIVLDSTGKVVEEPRFRMIEARVHETLLEKTLELSGELIFSDLRNHRDIGQIAVAAGSYFRHRFAIVNGDLRACSPEVNALMQAGPKHFPDDQPMLMEAATQLNGEVVSAITGNKHIIKGNGR